MIAVEELSVAAGEFRLHDVSFRIPTGEYGVLMGRTGSGKTTVLEAICGLKQVVSGRVWLQDVDVTSLRPADRNIGFVPQDGALFSTMRVREQIGFALAVRRVPRPEIERRVMELAELLDINELLDRSPKGLSGGERQRVALGRALAFQPRTLCLDEPLSALDAETREQMCDLLASVTRNTGVTTLHVTHSLDEAARLADHVFRIEQGCLVRSDLTSGGKLGG